MLRKTNTSETTGSENSLTQETGTAQANTNTGSTDSTTETGSLPAPSAPLDEKTPPEKSYFKVIQDTVDEDEEVVYTALNLEKKKSSKIGKITANNGMIPLQFAASCGNYGAVKWVQKEELHYWVGLKRIPDLYYETKAQGPALQFTVSYPDSCEEKEINGNKESKESRTDLKTKNKRNIIDSLMDAHADDKFTDATYFAPIIKSACEKKNFYFLGRFIVRLERVLEKRKEQSFLSENQFNVLLKLIIDASLDNNQSRIATYLLSKDWCFRVVYRYSDEHGSDIKKCLEKWDIEPLKVLLDKWYSKYKHYERIFNDDDLNKCIRQCIETENIELLKVLIKCSNRRINDVDYVSCVFAYLNEDKSRKQNAQIFLSLVNFHKVLITHVLTVCESNVFTDEEKSQLLLAFCKNSNNKIYLYSNPQLFDKKIQEIFSRIRSFNNPDLIRAFSACLHISQLTEERSDLTNIKVKYALGSEQEIKFAVGPQEGHLYSSYNYREKFHEYLREATKSDIENEKIELLKRLVDGGILNPNNEWKYQPPQSDSGSAKPVTNYLALQKWIVSYDPKNNEKLLADAKMILNRMDRKDVDHLLNLYAQRFLTKFPEIIELLRDQLREITPVHGTAVVASAPPQDEKKRKKMFSLLMNLKRL